MDHLREYIASHTGIVLAENKDYLIKSRLKNILTENHLPDIGSLLKFIECNPGNSMLDDVVDAITTHETSWFRDKPFFEYLERNIIPDLIKSSRCHRSIEVWSAATSSGQEAYSFSIVADLCLKKMKPDIQIRPLINILGTDISKYVIKRAKEGIYSPAELSRNMPDYIKCQYFDTLDDRSVRIKEDVRKNTRFFVHNLLHGFEALGTFDVVMCRNVLIYFDEKTIESIMRKIHGVLRKNGVLFLGSTENIPGFEDIYTCELTPGGLMYRAIH